MTAATTGSFDDSTRPTWLTEECPAWCCKRHCDDDLPDDRVHETNEPTVPVTRIDHRLEPDGGVRRLLRASDFEIVRYRLVGDDEEWVYVGDGALREQHLEVSLESASRLARRLSLIAR